jgi:hypothetical protein
MIPRRSLAQMAMLISLALLGGCDRNLASAPDSETAMKIAYKCLQVRDQGGFEQFKLDWSAKDEGEIWFVAKRHSDSVYLGRWAEIQKDNGQCVVSTT